MQEKTTGIVLHTIKYSDSASIATIFTRQFGRISYMVHGTNKKKSVCRAALLQSLSIVELDVFHSPGKDLQRIKDIRIRYPFTGIPFDPVKNAVALFLSEMLFRILRQTDPDENLFLFLENSIQQLDCCEKNGLANFHLVCLMKLTRYFGFEPSPTTDGSNYFDLMNGIFLSNKPLHSHYLLPNATAHFAAILDSNYASMDELSFTREERLKLLESTIEYYRLHIPDFNGLHSLGVLKSLFD